MRTANWMRKPAHLRIHRCFSTARAGGADGLPAIGEREAQDRIAYGLPEVLGRERAPEKAPEFAKAAC